MYQYEQCGDDTVSKEHFDILRELRNMNYIIVGHVGVTARHSNRFRVSVNTSPHRLEEKTRRRQIQSNGGKDDGSVGAVGDDVVDKFLLSIVTFYLLYEELLGRRGG